MFLSDYEGFGLTPLEALRAGVPVLVGDTPVAREVYGDAAVFVDTSDVPAIAAHLERLLFAPDVRSALMAESPGRPCALFVGADGTRDARGAARGGPCLTSPSSS